MLCGPGSETDNEKLSTKTVDSGSGNGYYALQVGTTTERQRSWKKGRVMEKRVELTAALEHWKLITLIVEDREEPEPGKAKPAGGGGGLVRRLRRLLARLESTDDSSGGHGGPGFFERSSTMETMEMKHEEEAVQSAGKDPALEIRRPPRPPDGQPLKAAAVQERLKAERVQEALKALPGWGLTARSKAIDRVYSFTSAALASAFAGYVTEAARLAEMPVDVSIAGSTLVVTLSAPLRGGGCGVTEGVLDFAKQLR